MSRAATKGVDTVPLRLLGTPTIEGLTDTIELRGAAASNSDTASGGTATCDALTVEGADDPTSWLNSHLWFTLQGYYLGNKVAIPVSTISNKPTSQITVVNNYSAAAGGVMKGYVSAFNGSADPTAAWKYTNIYDYTKYGNPAKIAYANLDLTYTYTETASGSALYGSPKKDVPVCVAKSEVTSVKFKNGDITVNPTNTEFAIPFWPVGVKDSKKVFAEAYSQYGRNMDLDTDNFYYTISDYVENNGEFAHVIGNHVIKNNGTDNVSVSGAEIGDSFTLTVKVKGTTLTATCKITVGADTYAMISDDFTVSHPKTGASVQPDAVLKYALGYSVD